MASEDFEMSCQMLDRIEARETMLAVNVAGFPHSKDSWRKSFHRNLSMISDPDKSARTDAMSTEQLAMMLSGRRG
jgi:thioesterase domain-containing protein